MNIFPILGACLFFQTAFPQIYAFGVDLLYTGAFRLVYKRGRSVMQLLESTESLELQLVHRLRANDNIRLLLLPNDVLLCIADTLEPKSLIFLAQTCRPLRKLLTERGGVYKALSDIRLGTRIERIQFLNIWARDRLDEWCCASCITLHPAMAQDVPYAQKYIEYMEDPILQVMYPKRHLGRYPLWIAHRYDPATVPVIFKHQHVQLALKYTRRLRMRHQQLLQQLQHQQNGGDNGGGDGEFTFFHKYYLERILAPFDASVIVNFYNRRGDNVGVISSFHPKVVQGPDGRYHFLLLSIYPESAPPGLQDTNAFQAGHLLRVCAHHTINYDYHRAHGIWLDSRLQRSTNYYLPAFDKRFVQHVPQRRAVKLDGNDDNIENGNVTADADTLVDTIEIHTSCARCPTDMIRRDGNWYVYQDFGTEDTASCDIAWQIYYLNPFNHPIWPFVPHDAGSIHKMYEESAV